MSTTTRLLTSTEAEPLLRFERLLADISARFIDVPADDLDGEIVGAQKAICETLGLSESVLWQTDHTDPGSLAMTHYYRESEPPPIPSPMRASEFFPWATRQLEARQVVSMSSVRDLPTEAARDAETFQFYGVKSTLAFPLYVGLDPLIGALSFETLDEEREWPESLQSRLKLLAQVFAGALARRRRELRLRESEARLDLAARSAGAGLWNLDLLNGKLWVTTTTLAIFGLPERSELDFRSFLRLVHPEDHGRIRATIDRALASGDEQSVRYRFLRQDGQIRWMSSRGRTHPDATGSSHLLMGVTADVTDSYRAEQRLKVLSTRLITAQEEERRRIARDLHDDISQCLAIVCMRLHHINDSVAGLPAAQAEIERVSERIGEIAKQVSQLSHQLHSAELEFLGLRIATATACREFESVRGIAVETQCDCIPPGLSKTAELCLFRVLQECLHNIAKHSRASRVLVELHADESEVSLTVEDNGCGFEPTGDAANAGLGLISMRERMLMVNGRLELVSRPGEGARVYASAPIVPRTVPKNESPAFTLVES